MEDINVAKNKLTDDYTIVLVKGAKSYVSKDRGIKPMLDFIEAGYDLSNFVVADKVVGKGAAVLFIYARIKEVYAKVISQVALDLLCLYRVKVSYDNLVPNIINRQGTDLCPMEKAVLDVNDIKVAYQILKAKNKELNH